MKRIAWLDTLRVLAALLVLMGHYSYVAAAGPEVHHFLFAYFVDLGQVGNMLFFAVSGYLAANSLENSSNILEYYRRKIIRLSIPYAAAYIVLTALVVLLGIFESKLLNQSPVQNLISDSGDLKVTLFGMLPLASDFNLIQLFQIPMQNFTTESFVGEWFMATIIYLYLISPLLYKLLRWNCAVTFAAFFIIAGLAFNLELEFANAGYIFGNRTFFLIRVPEFLLGMALFVYKDFISKNIRRLTEFFSVLAVALLIHSIFFNNYDEAIWARIFFNSPVNEFRHPIDSSPVNQWKYLLADIIIVYFSCIAAFYLNKHFGRFLNSFNSFSNISYLAMLMNRVVIYRFWWIYGFSNLSMAGALFFFVLIVLTIIFLSERILKIYNPVEERLIKRRLFLE